MWERLAAGRGFATPIKTFKDLGNAQNVSSIGGFTILGSGEVALIIDVPGLMGQVEHKKEVAQIAVTIV